MLILTRQAGEEILIDNGRIKFKILYERNGTVFIGIRAPRDVDIDRKEIFLRKRIDAQRKRIKKQLQLPSPEEI